MNEVPDDMKEADRLAQEAAAKIAEHVDAITILISKRREDGKEGTWRGVFGRGNWYARYGHVREWLLCAEADMTRGMERPTEEPE